MQTYSTSDLYLCAYLKSYGMRIIDQERTGNRVTFIFKDKRNREELINGFYNEGLVNVTSFVHAIKDIKAIVFNY